MVIVLGIVLYGRTCERNTPICVRPRVLVSFMVTSFAAVVVTSGHITEKPCAQSKTMRSMCCATFDDAPAAIALLLSLVSAAITDMFPLIYCCSVFFLKNNTPALIRAQCYCASTVTSVL